MLKFCGSLPVAITLMVALIAVLIPATCVENWYGPAAARFGVYGTWWFAALAVLLAVNVVAALVVRFPWRQRRTGFLLTHLGLLALLLGCLLTRRYGIDAQLPIFEGQAASTATEDSYHFQLTPAPAKGGDICVPFDPGPFNWAQYAQLPWFPWGLAARDRGLLYDRDGIRLEALDYCSDSRPITLPWLQLLTTPGAASPHNRPDADAGAAPLVLTVQASRDPHAAGRPFGLGGRRELAGGQRLVFWMTGDAAETAAFRQSQPDGPLGRNGRIVLYAGGRNYQFAVDQLQPKSRHLLGKTGLEVELVQFDPAFLAVQLRIHHGKLPPQKMLLLADLPELCEQDYRDGVFGVYWYDAGATAGSSSSAEYTAGRASSGTRAGQAGHRARPGRGTQPPAELLREAAAPRIDLLQGADGKLYYRAWQKGKWSGAGQMPPEGQQIDLFAGTPAATSLIVDRFLPSARPDIMPLPLPFSKTSVTPRRQVRVRLTVDGVAEEFWLGATPADPLEPPPENARRIVAGKNRRVALELRADEVGLGVQVFLRKFRRRLEPGASQASFYSSLIDFRDEAGHSLRSNVLVTLNQPVDFTDPVTGRRYRLFQTSFVGPLQPEKLDSAGIGGADPPPRLFLSWLTLNYDPGRGWKYLGCLLIVCGVFCRYFLRFAARGKAAAPVLLIAVVLAAGGTARAEDAGGLDWSAWRRLPVLDGGRIMPLDSFARATVEKIAGRQGPRLAPSGQAAEVLLSWLVEPERWEDVALLPAADPVLRSELLEVPLRDEAGRPLGGVSPRQVARAVKFQERLEQINVDRRRAQAAGRPAVLSACDKEAEDLFEAYSSFRMLTFHPLSPRDGYGRFIEKFSDVIRDWNDLEDELAGLFPPDQRAGAANPTAETGEAIRKLAALAERSADLSLDAAEPLAASLEHSAAALAEQTSALVERMVRSPPRLEEKQLRHIRMMVRSLAARTEDLARHAAAAHLALYDDGLALRPAPALDAAALEADRDPDDDAQPWAALQTLIHGSDDLMRRYPQPQLQELRKSYRQVVAAYRDRGDPGRAGRFHDAMQALAAALRAFGQAVEPLRQRLPLHDKDEVLMAATAYPAPGSTDAEVFYNRLDPFFWSWVAGLGAAVTLTISLLAWRRPLFRLGMLFLAATQALILTGLALRAYITGWTPVTNMFETIVFVALCVGLLGMCFALLLRWRGPAAAPAQSSAPTTVALAAAALATLALVVAYYVPAFPKDIRPLAPVLRSNLWLAVHVLSIVAGYGAAMLAFGLGYVASLGYLFGRYRDGREPAACIFLAALTYRMLQIAVLLLLCGTVLGALWADVSWGRFWGWDPKEVWALISLLVYLAFLHGRSVGWSGNFGTVFASVLGFTFIVMTWYGVNFFVSGGKHSYGEGAGGLWGTLTILALAGLASSWVWLMAAAGRYLVATRHGGNVGQAPRA